MLWDNPIIWSDVIRALNVYIRSSVDLFCYLVNFQFLIRIFVGLPEQLGGSVELTKNGPGNNVIKCEQNGRWDLFITANEEW
jgi:hypothetical protein